jgi:hypothetical protein
MSKSTTTTKELFTALGRVRIVDGRKKLELKSPSYFQHQISKVEAEKDVSVVISTKTPTRNEAQLAYYWVLLGFLAEHCGNVSKEEAHDALMRAKFGTKRVQIGNIVQEVRRSISDRAKMSKSDAVELISFAKECCDDLGIVVPTGEELGYISN